jgi:hypothetical protein
MQSFFFADLINSEHILMLSSLLFVAVIWQTATIFFLTDDVIVFPNPKTCSNGLFFCDKRSQCIVNALGFSKQILRKICNQFENKWKEERHLQQCDQVNFYTSIQLLLRYV